MTWTDLSAISEIVAAVAVVISLLYLSRQIHQNTHAVRLANANTLQNNFQGLARTLYTNHDVAAVVLKGLTVKDPLTPEEQLSAYAWFFDLLKSAELAHFHFRNGDLDPDLWHASISFYRAYFDTPGVRAYWQARRSAFVPEFQVAMDGWLTDAPMLERPDVLVVRHSSGA